MWKTDGRLVSSQTTGISNAVVSGFLQGVIAMFALLTGPLLALRRALPGKLTLTEADLFEPGSFDDVVKGADFVYHTASNVIFDSSNPEVRGRS